MKLFKRIFAAATIAAALSAPALADTLVDVTSSGKLRVGVLLDAAPWGYKDAEGKDTGLDVELARMMAKDLNADLNSFR